jgi:ABC-type transport system involved in cytochrome bd biosynthesis fused ATPase/permease subunit
VDSDDTKGADMYVIPIIVLAIVIALSLVWTPIFAFLIAVPLFLLFLAYVGFSRRSDQKATGASGAPASGEGGTAGGIWGEKEA